MVKHEKGLRPRKSVKDSKRFKTNQVTIGNSKIARASTETECPQVALLSKLYIPGKNLQRLNEASKKQLLERLPWLVDPGLPELNFEIHLFLSSIVTNFVCSWYTKLGTDNYDFVAEVYTQLCVIVKDIVTRLTREVEGERFLFVVDDIADILKDHIGATALENGQFRFLHAQKASLEETNRVARSLSDEQIIDEYLATQHAIFDPKTRPSESSQDSRTLYFEVLTHKLLEAIFDTKKENPLSSDIVDKFVVGLVGDFVLNKAFMKMSSPSFIIGTVIGKIAEISTVEPKPQTKSSLVEKAKSTYASIFSLAQVAMVKKEEVMATDENTAGWSVFNSPVFALFNSFAALQKRLPFVFHAIGMVQTIIQSLGPLTSKINTYASSYLLKTVSSSPLLEDRDMAANLKNLRCILFEEQEEKPGPPLSTQEVAEKLYTNFQTILSNLGASSSFFTYDGETEEELQANFANAITRFESQEACNDLNDSSKLNQLLIIRLLDFLVGSEEIVNLLSESGKYSYREPLESVANWPSSNDEQLSKGINTIELFAFGDFASYLRQKNSFLDLSYHLAKKLAKLTLISVCNENEGREVSFDALLREYSLEQALEGKPENLEQLIIEMIDEDLIVAKIDEQQRTVKFIESLSVRDAYNANRYTLRVLSHGEVHKRSVTEAREFLKYWLDHKVVPAQAELKDVEGF
ncbi:hypothetical protein FT663_02044 [Candidozyma haemuli var. vulneris]|nr:hypothetical protein FT662_02541 [[Candida] haemuloni var. vulneris]KAF3993035.1 hypothetical protein FT663_02044 [[Candida] haemuloni var. vulneris]